MTDICQVSITVNYMHNTKNHNLSAPPYDAMSEKELLLTIYGTDTVIDMKPYKIILCITRAHLLHEHTLTGILETLSQGGNMGQKAFKNNTMMTLEGLYPTREACESYPSGFSHKESANAHQHTFNAFCAGISQRCSRQESIGQSMCEFQDYCNHLYYIDDRCDCASVWQKRTGLVIPTST